MTTSQPEPGSTTPELGTEYSEAKALKEPPTSCSSSIEVNVPALVDTVFAKSSKPREVVVAPARIKASLEALDRNRKIERMGLG